ncbi:MAG: LLM class flavin-dependent oxidoreductase [Rhodoferax sp.]|nr:MAG: LLM class flavin-dependent oxidoreductase [Rhodoferax sp.]
MIPLSILELGRVRQGSDRRTALDNARTLAQHAERLGFRRIWVAEHHNSPAVSTAATSVVLSHIAAGTTTIRVGAGGVMLPNHAPYVIAEQFGTLETLYPGRIDLGLGRAPGTDQMTLRALRRDPGNAESFPHDVLELQAYLAPKGETQRIEAVPGSGTNVPLWILGSSLFGAQLAATLGLPYAFGSQFSPQALHQALDVYRTNFQPSEQLQKPYVLIGVNVIAAETDAEARVLATSQQMTFADMFRGMPSLLKPPVDDIETYWTPVEKAQTEQMLSCSVVGSAATVRDGLNQLVAETKADELMIVSDIFDFSKRVRSLEITTQAAT